MSEMRYNWKRYWRLRGSFSSAYSSPMDSTWQFEFSSKGSDTISLDLLNEIPVLGLLGEPGMGKSSEIEVFYQETDAKLSGTPDDVLSVNLKICTSEACLYKEIFDHKIIETWLAGNHKLHLFLDSLDECQLSVAKVITLLEAKLKDYPTERLFLRIGCRTAEWPESLESLLKELWGEKQVSVYELEPLQWHDIVEALEANGTDVDAFRQEVERVGVLPLAIKPITLRFLIAEFKKRGHLPRTQAEIYKSGCLLLCTEENQDRVNAKLIGNLSPSQRLSIASRMAAATIFSGYTSISTDIRGDLTFSEEGLITIGDIYENPAREHQRNFTETLNTGLFSSRGANKLGWAHQTYAEFLAAYYLVEEKKVPLLQVMTLLVHSDDSEGKLVPQLHEVAAWLASMNSNIFRKIAEREPEVLLRSDVTAVTDDDKAMLIEILLDLYDKEQLLGDPWGGKPSRYKKLSHPKLGEQLKPYIFNKEKNIRVRDFAIDLAEACDTQNILNVLVQLVVDPTENYEIRLRSAHAIRDFDNDDAKTRLKEFIFATNGSIEERLKGLIFDALWPKYLDTKTLFSMLTRPSNPYSVTTYVSFLHKLSRNLSKRDLIIALGWVEKFTVYSSDEDYNFNKFVDQILLESWEHLDATEILNAFARAILPRLENLQAIIHDDFDWYNQNSREQSFKFRLFKAVETRHKIVDALLPILLETGSDPSLLFYPGDLLEDSDLEWLISRIDIETSEDVKQILVELLRRSFRSRRDHWEMVAAASENHPIIAEMFREFFSPVPLDSEQAQKLREDHKRYKELEDLRAENQRRREEEHPLLDPPPLEGVKKLLEECIGGDSKNWWKIGNYLAVDPYGRGLSKDFQEPDLRALPGWPKLSPEMQNQIVEGAKDYLLTQTPTPQTWLEELNDKGTLHWVVIAGYKALRLLFVEQPLLAFDLPNEVWQKWSQAILAYRHWDGAFQDDIIYTFLVKMAYEKAPNEVIDALLSIIDAENRGGHSLYVLAKIEECWDQQLMEVLEGKLRDTSLKPNIMGDLLRALLQHKSDEGRNYAESLLSETITDEDTLSKFLEATYLLTMFTDDGSWATIWPLFINVELGKKILTRLMAHNNDSAFILAKHLTESQLADLYNWVAREFPPSDDPRHEGAYWESPRDRIADWRNQILAQLRSYGTFQACHEIKRLIQEFPDQEILKWSLIESQKAARSKTWSPPKPREIINLSENSDKRLVRNGSELLEVVRGSLNRLQQELHGETPAVRDLWNENPIRPKDEEALSNYIKRFFDRDIQQRGIVANREVQIHKRLERTDIRIDAIVAEDSERYSTTSVIIEVKGSWHRDLDDAMETQLVRQYLTENPRCQHGLYLIGWFGCDQWDKDDHRNQPKPSIENAREQFNSQAISLSNSGRTIKAYILDTSFR